MSLILYLVILFIINISNKSKDIKLMEIMINGWQRLSLMLSIIYRLLIRPIGIEPITLGLRGPCSAD